VGKVKSLAKCNIYGKNQVNHRLWSVGLVGAICGWLGAFSIKK
jgi:hypothetical protein